MQLIRQIIVWNLAESRATFNDHVHATSCQLSLVTRYPFIRYVNAQTARFFREYNLNSSLFIKVCVMTFAPTLEVAPIVELLKGAALARK
jgi:hypothetical protein